LKEVIQDPKYIGPLLIMILLVAVNVGSTYAIVSKEYYEQILPTGENLDQWTENSTTFWTSNANVTLSNDSINGTYYGNTSIAFSIQNSSEVWMNLTGIGTVDCSAPNGYYDLTLRAKWTDPVMKPENVTIQMYSANSSSDYFYNDLTDTYFSNSTYNIWNNLTIPLNSTGWSNTPNADWRNITGLRLQFTWAQSSNVTLLIDGLFFHGPFLSLLDIGGTSYMLNYGVLAAMQFAVTWIVFTGLIYILARAFGGKPVWRPMLIAVGFILVTMFVMGLINAIGYATLPTLRFPFELIGGVQGEGDAAINTISEQTFLFTQITRIAQILIWAWTVALAAIAVRLVAEFSWAKSIAVATVAYVVTIFIESFLVG
jgi:hypothetical protein